MNWLAHALLSPADSEIRLGNLLADVVKGAERKVVRPGFAEGIRRHRVIDGFTDWHPVVYQSRRRISEPWGRFAGILVDIFYDHFLARHWRRFECGALEQFTAGVYDDLRVYREHLPPLAREVSQRMIEDDRLTSYREIEGIRSALGRLSNRIRERSGREVHLEQATEELVGSYAELEGDFLVFFPELSGRCGGGEKC